MTKASPARIRAQKRYYERHREEILARQRDYWIRSGAERARTPERKAARRKAMVKWHKSPQGRQYRERYWRSVRGKEVSRRAVLKKLYGISDTQYNEMLATQGGKCAICGGINKNGRPLFVDHHHETKTVRALLCLPCNSVVGHCREDITILERTIKYLRKHLTTVMPS